MASQISNSCTNCKMCESICPTQSIYPGDTQYVIDSDTCEDCKVCLPICPVEAITTIKNK